MKYKLSVVQMSMKNIFTCVAALCAPFGLFAQTEENPELQKTIQVYSEYKPQISDASRISVNPKVYDTLDLQVNLKYSVSTSPLNTDYHIIPLRAVSVKGDKLQELYRGEAVVGAGNYWTGLLSVRYMTERSRLKQSGIELYHFGSAGKVKMDNGEKNPAGYTTDYINAYWKRFYENFTLYASIKPQYKSVLRYGYDSVFGLSEFDKKKVRRNILGLNANAGIVSHKAEDDALRYGLDVDYQLTNVGKPSNLENLVDISGGLHKKMEKLSLGLNADFRMSALNFQPVDTLLSKLEGVATAMPYVKVGANAWNLQVGVNLTPAFGGYSTFKVFPDVRFVYSLPKLKLVPYFNFYGAKVDLKSLYEMLDENPYASDNTMLRPCRDILGFELGVNGRLKKLVTYNVQLSADAYENMYFWTANIPDSLIGSEELYPIEKVNTTYDAVYDNATLMKVHGDLGFLFRKMNLGIDANYYYWQLDSLKYAWYKPIVDATVSTRFDIVNPNSNKTKMTVEPQLYYMLYQSEGHGLISKKSIVDLGVEVNYFYNSVLRLFLDVNNICGLNNERYMDYPTQRCNFLIGLSYSFDGHKE
ncbi:MAG: hypothetical protein MJ198_00875 [Bacteroidales bacterium]|nr:hypothetical protein [Bacteroidales bacterium]